MSGCTTTSYSCSNSGCTVNLSGAGAETEINNDTITVTLIGASDGVAEYSIDGATSTCAQGDAQQVGGFDVVCTEVGDDKLTLQIS